MSEEQQSRLTVVQELFEKVGKAEDSLSASCRRWFGELGISFGLRHHGIPEDNLASLAKDAFEDPCHATNIIPVSESDLFQVLQQAF